MRITVVAFSRRKIGGIEHHLDLLIPELVRRGHRLQMIYMNDVPANRGRIEDSGTDSQLHVSDIGSTQTLLAIRRFAPDVINIHGDIPPEFHALLLPVSACVYSVHSYYGTCISGHKATQFPMIQPCSRRLGTGCLVRYFPQRCGGLNPVTMVRRYAREKARLKVIADCDAVVTHSQRMLEEYLRHGILSRIYTLPYEADANGGNARERCLQREGPVRILFAGRMDKLKGGHLLIAAAPLIARALKRDVELDFAGDGPDRARWERLANRTPQQCRITFHGWQSRPGMEELLRHGNLFAFPSLLPEPFGKAGLEAMAQGLPVAAFAVGGITDWLRSGENGFLADRGRLGAAELAAAIVNCLEDPDRYARLSRGALLTAERFRLGPHVDSLSDLFEAVRRNRELHHLTLAAGA